MILGVGVMIIDESDRVLLGRRIKKGEVPSWCFPGGKVEKLESFEQAGLREVREETGVSLELFAILPFTIIINKNLNFSNMTVGLFSRVNSLTVSSQLKITEPDVFESWQWFHLSELPSDLFLYSKTMIDIWKKDKVNNGFEYYLLKDKD